MSAPASIGDYFRMYGRFSATTCCRGSRVARPGDSVSIFAVKASLSRPGHGDHGHRQVLAGGSVCGGRGGVRNRQDADISRERFHARQRTALHVSHNGAPSAR
jgi:hypothetical protein